jgi:hypothetical protein
LRTRAPILEEVSLIPEVTNRLMNISSAFKLEVIDLVRSPFRQHLFKMGKRQLQSPNPLGNASVYDLAVRYPVESLLCPVNQLWRAP